MLYNFSGNPVFQAIEINDELLKSLNTQSACEEALLSVIRFAENSLADLETLIKATKEKGYTLDNLNGKNFYKVVIDEIGFEK